MSDKKSEPQRISAVAPFGLRMLPELRERIEAAAAENGRSLNAEITSRLEWSLDAYQVRDKDGAKRRPMTVAEYENLVEEVTRTTGEKVRALEERFDALIREVRATGKREGSTREN